MAWLFAWWIVRQSVTVGYMAGGVFVLSGPAVVITQQKPSERVEDEPVN